MRTVYLGWNGNMIKAINNVYTFEMGVWNDRASMPNAVSDHSAVAMSAAPSVTLALVCGGVAIDGSVMSTCFTYSSTENSWTTAQAMNVAREGHGMVVYKGNVLQQICNSDIILSPLLPTSTSLICTGGSKNSVFH
jgi:hypothetical protein